MGLFASLFVSKAPERPSGKKDVVYLMGPANFRLEIIGEDQYQAALEAICGPHLPKGVHLYETASLILEDKNPHDQNAVRIEIQRKHVGYLSPETAMLLRAQLKAKGRPKSIAQCAAVIRGGWVSSDGRKGDFCVWLDLPISYQ